MPGIPCQKRSHQMSLKQSKNRLLLVHFQCLDFSSRLGKWRWGWTRGSGRRRVFDLDVTEILDECGPHAPPPVVPASQPDSQGSWPHYLCGPCLLLSSPQSPASETILKTSLRFPRPFAPGDVIRLCVLSLSEMQHTWLGFN